MNGTKVKYGFVHFLKVVLTSAALWAALVAVASAESISSFSAEYVIAEDNTVTVTETIVYDFGTNERRGIFREVRASHPQPSTRWYQSRFVDIEPLSVTRNGQTERFVDEGSGDDMYLRIGNADITITGAHTYEITYRLTGALSVPADGPAEFYWNVTGANWSIPIENIAVTVSGPSEMSNSLPYACYAGPQGASTRCDSTTELSGNAVLYQHTQLSPGEQVTIAQAIDPVTPVTPLQKTSWTILLPLLLSVFGIVGSWLVYRWRTYYKPNTPVIAQYEPYQDFKPMFTGVLLDNRLDPSDITAGIIYLAQQGFITITQKTEKVLFLFDSHDYEVTLLRSPEEVSTSFQKDLLKLLFYGQAEAGEKKSLFRFTLSSLSSATEHLDMEPGKTIRLSEVKANQTKQRSNLKLIKQLKKDVEKDLVERGFIEQRMSRAMKGGFWAVGVFVFFVAVQFVVLVSVELFFTALVGFVALIIASAFALERRTRKGYEALNHLKGFKDFLSTTEKERYTFHNAPRKNAEQFMEFLPYAVAFGVEKEWAEVFKDMHISDPDWYQSDVPGGAFSAVAFSNEISSFSSSLSTSSGSSGSSGSGSSGGGGGGGGGGSW